MYAYIYIYIYIYISLLLLSLLLVSYLVFYSRTLFSRKPFESPHILLVFAKNPVAPPQVLSHLTRPRGTCASFLHTEPSPVFNPTSFARLVRKGLGLGF